MADSQPDLAPEVPAHIEPESRIIPLERIIEYQHKGLNNTEIGKLLGCEHHNITQRLQAAENLELFKKHRAEVMATSASMLVNSLTPADIKEMNGLQKITAFGILYDKERLERGQSTANVHNLVEIGTAKIEDLRSQAADLEAELAELESSG